MGCGGWGAVGRWAGGMASLTDRWSSNPHQDFIESVASVTGYSCERLPPQGAGRAGQNKSRPLVAFQGLRMPFTQSPGFRAAKWSSGVFPVG